jgi:hypothetical protein
MMEGHTNLMSTRLRANAWIKATASGLGNCVEVRLGSGAVEIRDSKNPSGGSIVLSPDAYRGFIGYLKDDRAL